jgi:addiction module HigA family antidote
MAERSVQIEPPKVADVLRIHFLALGEITQEQLAEAMGVSRHTVSELMNGKRAVTAVMALRLAQVLGTDPEFWLNLQQASDLYEARTQHGSEIARLKPLRGRRSVEQIIRPLNEVFAVQARESATAG